MFTKVNYCKPKSKKALIVSDELFSSSKEQLAEFGFNLISTFVNNNVNPYLSRHADMQIVHIADRTYVCSPDCYDYYKQQLKNYYVNLLPGYTYLSCNYPEDIAYNIIITEKFAIHNFKYTDSLVCDLISGKSKINVSQGYSGCSVCKIASDVFITSDCGIAKALNKAECSVLQISHGNIILDGFNEGFIGGASFLISDKLLAVNGNLKLHPDYELVNSFCLSHGVEIISLSDNNITDIGSAVAVYSD